MGAYNSPNPQAIFYQQYDAVHRDEVVGVLLALCLGGFGAHQFYLRRTGLGIFYLIFFWTPFPWIAGFIECFFMPGRVRVFNAVQAASIASYLGITAPIWAYPTSGVPVEPPQAYAAAPTLNACPRCMGSNQAGARFCSACGQALQ
jgi:TM2 domain-containing membrane protein YozV